MSSQRKVSDLIQDLQDVLEKCGDLPLVSSSDDEGNDFRYVYYRPTIGYYKDREFTLIDDYLEDETIKPNAVCIN